MTRRKKAATAFAAAFGCALCIVAVYVFIAVKSASEERAREKSFLAPFHEVYDALCGEYPFITSLRGELGGGYAMYYIECDIAEDEDCFAELVNVQRGINDLMEAQDGEWFDEFDGHVEVSAGRRSLRVFYHNGSMSNEFWADDVISDDYGVLWDAFPEVDDIRLVIYLAEYSEETAAETARKYEGRNIEVAGYPAN
ncbi:MAG: hypothetical protein NC299_00125 [Lachnospiraceae bacterium]|nr:hypothetical protein [Ruminococcus sp.]MCM1273752.1 hypothetical protein [Lachnospiraceae bacterium]